MSAKTIHTNSPSAHSILTITLSGPSLFLAIIALIFCINLCSPSFTTTLLALGPLFCIIHNDYNNFLSLGPGGTPSTFAGYLKITYLRIFALSDPFAPPTILGRIRPETGALQAWSAQIPIRRGPRPMVAGIAPQRQRDQFAPRHIYQSFRDAVSLGAERNPQQLGTGVSCFEKNGLALFAFHPLNNTCAGEICHVHHLDGSLHMSLHPLDAKVVLERGWGQRHPLANAEGGWMSKYVPREFTLVYAPRDVEELDVVCAIVEAAAWWVTGRRVVIRVPERTGEAEMREIEGSAESSTEKQ